MSNSDQMEHCWPTVNLVEQLEQIIDNRGKTPAKSETGIPSLSAKSVKMGEIDYSKVYYVSDETYTKFMVRGLPKVGDVLLTTEAPLGCVARLDRDDVCLAQRLITLRGKEGVLDNDYLRFYLSSPIGQHELTSRASGSTVQGIKRSEFCKVDIVLPPYDKQLEIASKVRSIEEKITLNRKTNQTFEELAKVIFQSWFIYFEPTRAKVKAIENNQDPQLAAMAAIAGRSLHELESAAFSPEQLDRLRSIATLFPEKLVDSEFGLIPEGWDITTVGDHVSVTKGRSYKSSELKESSTALVTLKSFMRGGGYREDGLKEYIGVYKPEQVIEPGELIMSLTDVTQAAEIVGKPAIVTRNKAYETLVASLDVAILRPIEHVNKEYFYGLMSTHRFHHYAESFATGTTVLHLNPKGITSFTFAKPHVDLCRAYSDIVRPMLKKHEGNIHESRNLEQIKEAMLPRLLSGALVGVGTDD